jgi:hypothetical protein
MRTIGLSGFKGDISKHLMARVKHLLAKPGIDHWFWGVRETNDMTYAYLKQVEGWSEGKVTVSSEEFPAWSERILHLSVIGDMGLSVACANDADRVLIHESDLITPVDIVEMLSGTDGSVVGGWPVLANQSTPEDLMLYPGAMRLSMEQAFYDTWAYRAGGERFTNEPPYHPAYRADKPFQLESVGSVALIDASYLRRGARMFPEGFVGLCDSIRALGGTVWCDPTVPVIQPLELWTFNDD